MLKVMAESITLRSPGPGTMQVMLQHANDLAAIVIAPNIVPNVPVSIGHILKSDGLELSFSIHFCLCTT